VTSGDYLAGFLQGTREALSEAGRESLTLTIDRLDARAIGTLIALYERAVGYYASLTGINAYHQPGVEAGKKAAGVVLQLQAHVLAQLRTTPGKQTTAAEIATAIGAPEQVETIFRLLRHLATNPDHRIGMQCGATLWESRFQSIP
jgi:glucose-6-phosphate isomerase